MAAAITVAAMAATAGEASAITFNFSPGPFSNKAARTDITFDPAPPAGYAPAAGVVSGDLPNQFKQPDASTGNYFSVGGSNAPGPLTVTLPGLKGYFGLLWGSIDTYNTIDFLKNGVSVGSFTGTEIAALAGLKVADATNGNFGIDRYVNFFSTTGNAQTSPDYFDQVRFSSAQAAFESDNHAYAIPTPALLPGLIGLGVAALRKRKQNQQSEAEA